MSGTALLLAGSALKPRFCAIGSGSGAEVATLGSLVAEVLTERLDHTSADISATNEVGWTFDYNSVTMSGVGLTEFGITGSQAKGTQDCYNREAFSSITFDGTNELQINITFKTF